MKIRINEGRAGFIDHVAIRIDDHPPIDAVVRRDHAAGTIEVDVPDLIAIDADTPIELDATIAEVLRRYLPDVSQRHTVGEALANALAEREAKLERGAAGTTATFRELEKLMIARAAEKRSACDQQNPMERDAARDFSMSITSLEDAGIRYTRGLSGLMGTRSDVDIEKLATASATRAERAEFEARVKHAADPGADDSDPGEDTGAGAIS